MPLSRSFTYMQLANLKTIESLYAQYLKNPSHVDPSWRFFFEGVEFGEYSTKGEEPQKLARDLRVVNLIDAYRRFGRLRAQINPISTQQITTP